MICLLTGANGGLGTELDRISDQYGLEYYKMDGRKCMDITREKDLIALVSGLKGIECVVHCAAFTDVPGAELRRKEAIEVNVIGTKNIVSAAKAIGARMMYVSTDYVYAGAKGEYKETDPTNPINFYAWTKLAGEAYLGEEDLIVRTSFKPSKWKHTSAFNDLYTSADYTDVIAARINELVKRRAQGVYNVGTERKSVWELAQRRNPEVIPRSRLELAVSMPSDVSMCTDKYDELIRSNNGG